MDLKFFNEKTTSQRNFLKMSKSINISKRLRKPTFASYSDDELSQRDMSSNGSFVDSEDDQEYQPKVKRSKTFTNVTSTTERKPTRVPDPSVKNRNALLARENRQRKKQEMEILQNKNAKLQEENRKLHKIVKYKDTKVTKMAYEIQYLRAILNNSPAIASVLKTINLSPPKEDVQQKLPVEFSPSGSSDTASAITDDLCKFIENWKPDSFSNELNFQTLDIPNEYDGLKENPFNSFEDYSYETPPRSTPSFDDHTYMQTEFKEATPGVCVHINSGKVSLEFCSSCHMNATEQWIQKSI